MFPLARSASTDRAFSCPATAVAAAKSGEAIGAALALRPESVEAVVAAARDLGGLLADELVRVLNAHLSVDEGDADPDGGKRTRRARRH